MAKTMMSQDPKPQRDAKIEAHLSDSKPHDFVHAATHS